MKPGHFSILALICAILAITLALLDFIIISLIFLGLSGLSASTYWEKSNEEENIVDSEGKHTLFSAQAKKTTGD